MVGVFRSHSRSLIILVTAGGVPWAAYRPCQMVRSKFFRPISRSVG